MKFYKQLTELWPGFLGFGIGMLGWHSLPLGISIMLAIHHERLHRLSTLLKEDREDEEI